jgi:beta-xylosidase
MKIRWTQMISDFRFEIGSYLCLSAFLSVAINSSLLHAQTAPLDWGDQGNGTYKNPILKSDFSDPDILRVGDDFYLIASDFHFVGMQVLHSKDLVNWQIIGQVFDKLTMDPKYDQMKGYGQGTWAPSLRYHNGEFYIFVCTPYDGLFMWHTKNPAGPWSDTVTVKKIPQWEDPCPFWDDDGKAYLVHSHKGAGPLYLHRMSADGTQLLDDGKLIYQGKNSEGPKLYKRHGYYFISLPEGGVATGGQVVLRSRNIYGPYERRQVLPDGSPHQGGMVELDNGQGWFISFKSTGFLGRITYLNPVTWGTDDWPVFGDNGKSVITWPKPNVGRDYPTTRPWTSDEFDDVQINPIWQWNHNPVDSHWSLLARPGFLRLTALPADSLATARNTLTQKIWDNAGAANLKLDATGLAEGDCAGFTFVCGSNFGWIGVKHQNGQNVIAWPDGTGPVLTSNNVWLGGRYDGDAARMVYSLDGTQFTDCGQTFKLRFLNWKGARVGLFCFGSGGGSADFDWFHYSFSAHLPPAQ